MIGFKYGSQHTGFSIVAKSISRPLLPALRKKEVEIPGRDGTHDFSDNTYENRQISVLLQYVGESFVDLRSIARWIAAWLGQKKYEKLIFDDEPDKYYMAKVYDAVDLVVADLLELGKATVVFDCKPFAYSVEEYSWTDRLFSETKILQNGGTEPTYPLISIRPVPLSGGMDEAVEVTGGFDPADPVVTSPGLTNPAITIGGETLVYVGTVTDDQILIFNVEKYQATKNGSNVLNTVSGDWPMLEADNNEISVVDTTSDGGIIVEILFRKRWL